VTGIAVRRLDPEEIEPASRVQRAAFDAALPWLAGPHTPEEDAGFWRDHVGATCRVWGIGPPGGLLGVMAVAPGWIEQLYVLPEAQGRGVGSALLAGAQAAQAELSLWTFQRNVRAQAFYEERGFRLVRETDGSENMEREPDALYRWERAAD
jgi:putative acetyltransferase